MYHLSVLTGAPVERVANYRRLWLTQRLHQFIQIAHDGIEQLVHQLGFYHFRDVRDDAFAGTGHPTGFGVGTAAAQEYEHAGIGPSQRCPNL